MTKLRYEKATIENIDTIYNIVQNTIKTICPKYYPKEVVEFFYNLHSKENIKKDIKQECEGKFVGAGGVSYYNVMPTYHNHTGRKAYIMNMYTKPEYRRKGIAIKTLELLVKDAQEKGITDISLEATDIGKPLYEKFGFVAMESEMKL